MTVADHPLSTDPATETMAPSATRESSESSDNSAKCFTLSDYSQTIRSMIQHENDLTNHRVTWLITLNGLLFTGLAFVWGKDSEYWVVTTLCVVGLFSSVSLFAVLDLSSKARTRLEQLWLKKDVPEELIPPVRGFYSHEAPRVIQFYGFFLPWLILPLLFFVAWIVLLVVNWTK